MAFEWINPLLGGILISFSLCAFLIINDTNFGIGDMLKNALERKPSVSWNNQILFLIGLLVSPIAFTTLFYPITNERFQSNPVILILSGLLVGIGYKLCNGGLITRAVLTRYYCFKSSLVTILIFLCFGELSRLILMFGNFK